MKIKTLTYRDTIKGWSFSNVNFFNLTLLVGVSGVGKTQILDSILNIKKIAKGKSLNGVEWEISFIHEEKNYLWEGKFEKLNNYEDSFFVIGEEDKEIVKPKIINEAIYLNEELISSRNKNDLIFLGKKMPKLSSEESIISIFKEEETIKLAYEGFKKIVFRDHTQREDGFSIINMVDNGKNISKYETLEEIRNSELNTIEKLKCLYENQKVEFNKIVENYKDIFPQVEDVKIEPFKNKNLHELLRNISIIQFKEQGTKKWITQDEMSSGMIRTFLHISEMFLLSKGTIVLIDEFENSLGVNCINVLTEDLIIENHRIQFIATSHHPYIINQIPYDYWKIVTRRGGTIKVFDAKEFNLGASSHERFLNLINLPQYKDGIESLS